MKYIITGGSGFIGSHLVDRLLETDNNRVKVIDGHDNYIRVIDDFSHGKFANLTPDPRLTVYSADIRSEHIGHLFKGVDVVFHLAALTRPQWSIDHAYETNDVNVDGTLRILDHCVKNKVKRIVFMSSSNLYGDAIVYPTPEFINPNPMNAYALTKSIGEQYCELFYKLYGLEYNAIRPFNVYGKRMPLTGIWTSAVATFINVLKNDLPLEMFGDGHQRRDFIHVDDVIDMMLLLAHSKITGEVFNCGSGTNTSINELYELICKLMDKKIKPRRNPAQFEPSQTLADITKAEVMLDWKPKISLEEGLKKTI